MASTTLNYLIEPLRLHLGDIDSTAYRYMDEWLLVALILSVKGLQRWWNYKYLVNNDNTIYRNTEVETFIFPEPPVIENADERPIILMASIIIKEGSLENSAWSTATWRDAEIYYSNVEGSKSRRDSLQRDWDELTATLKVPQKRLARALRGALPGFKFNIWEN